MFISQLRPALFLLAEASETPPAGGGDQTPVDPAAAIAAIEDATVPMSQRLGLALKALKGIPPTEQFATVQTELTTTKATLATKEKELADANARVIALQADVTTFETSNARLEQENKDLKAKEQDLEKRSEAKSKEKLAALGFPASNLPPSSDAEVQDIAADEKELEKQLAKPGMTFADKRAAVKAFDDKRLAAKA